MQCSSLIQDIITFLSCVVFFGISLWNVTFDVAFDADRIAGERTAAKLHFGRHVIPRSYRTRSSSSFHVLPYTHQTL